MKKVFNIIGKIGFYLVIIIALFAVVFTMATTSSGKKTAEQKLFGYKFFTVLSDSMSATDFSAGDMIFSKEVDPNDLEEGDIITFISDDPNSHGKIITHKIRSIKYYKNGKLEGFVTYGTTTGKDDERLVLPEYIIGQYKFRLPKAGYVANFLKTTPGFIVIIVIPFVIIISCEISKIVRVLNHNKREKQKAIDLEREELLAAERSKTEQMLKEIEELKKKLANESSDSN